MADEGIVVEQNGLDDNEEVNGTGDVGPNKDETISMNVKENGTDNSIIHNDEGEDPEPTDQDTATECGDHVDRTVDDAQPEKIEEATQQVPQLSKKELEEKRKRDSEMANYWKAVKENPMDFTGWTYLLQFVEQGSDLEACRKAYEAFFSHYPYCYGYWKKFSDVEKRHGDLQKSVEVFEKGLRAVPLSVELWLHFLNFYSAEFSKEKNFSDMMRSLYKRALAAAGLEFRSDKLWDSYINWENSNGDLQAVTGVYEKLISTPTQLYSHHWENFCRHANNQSPKDYLDSDTFMMIRSTVLSPESNDHTYDDEDECGAEEGAASKEDVPPGMAPSLMDDGEEIKKIRAYYLDRMEKVHKANEVEVSKRWTFEETIRRPYFHVKPLERGQLKNWKDYLDFEISIGNHKRIVVLFERCMIACALYEDFWMKYAKYLELHSIDGVRSVYQRACDIHLPKKPYIHLAWAAFEERKDNYPLARKILMNIENNVPGLAMVCMRRISLERRNGNHEAAEELFKAYIQKAVSQKARAFFSIKYARYLQKVTGDIDRAREVLTAALDPDNMNERIFLQLLDVEYQAQPVEEDRVHDIFDRLFKSNMSLDFKIKVSQRRMEFLEDFGTCIQKITDAYDEHQKLLKESNTNSKKKKAEKEPLAEEPPDKKTKTSEASQTVAQPSYPPVTNNYNPPLPQMPAPPLPQTPAPPLPQMPAPPLPQAPAPPLPHQAPPDGNMYNYGQWPNPGYPNNMQPGMYPGYQYPSYPPQQQQPQHHNQQPPPYGYYGYQ